jgi:hypothetical protein
MTGRMTRERIARLAEDDWRNHDPRFQEPQLSDHPALGGDRGERELDH